MTTKIYSSIALLAWANAFSQSAPQPSLDRLKAELNLRDEQAAQLQPLLEKSEKQQKELDLLQQKATQANEKLSKDLEAKLTDEQKRSLPQALFMARFNGGRGGGETPAADKPSPRSDPNSMKAHEQLLVKRTQGKIDAYFMGDSITRRWGATDYPDFLAHWKETFHGWNAANFGWGADGLQHMLWRLDNGELDGVNPKVIVFLGGTNNIGDQPGNEAKAEEIFRGIKEVLGRFRQKAPSAIVILTSVLPRGQNPQLHTFIQGINQKVAALADGKTIRYLDLFPKFSPSLGNLNDEAFTPDQLHLSLKGYHLWSDALKPLFTEILGPPAKEDLAPPPTGDPSAQK